MGRQLGLGLVYKVVRISHEYDQNPQKPDTPSGPQPNPHWVERGEFLVTRGGLAEMEKLKADLQKSHDTATHPFRFTTFEVREEVPYPEHVV